MSLSPLLIPNILYNRALDKYFQPPPPKNCKKKKNKTRTKLGSIEHHLSFVKRRGQQGAFSCVLFLSSYYFRGDGTKAVNKLSANFSQIPSLLHDRCHEKKIVFLNKPFIAFFILQVLKNSDFSYLSLLDFFRLFRPIIIERGNLCKFSLSQAMFVWHHAADSYTGSRCFYR